MTFIRDLFGPRYAGLQAEYVSARHTLEHIAPVREFMRLVRKTIGQRPLSTSSSSSPIWSACWRRASSGTSTTSTAPTSRADRSHRLFRAEGFDVQRLYKAYDDQYLMIEAIPGERPNRGATMPQEDDLASTAALVRKFPHRGRPSPRGAWLPRPRTAGSRSGQTVAIWGSGSKCVSLMSSLDLGDALRAIVDINPHKHGKFLAGSGWEIQGPDALTALRPDAVIIMNSIYTEEIRHELATRGLQPQLLPL